MLLCYLDAKSDHLVSLLTNLCIPNNVHVFHLISTFASILAFVSPQGAGISGDVDLNLLT
jgi:hypothetical protein